MTEPKPIIVWELFSGTGDISLKIHEMSNGKVKSMKVDWSDECIAEYHADIGEETFEHLVQVLGFPSFIWASPDCTTYSIAQHSLHRAAGGVAVDWLARFNDSMNENLWNNILGPANRLGIPFIVENPKGMYQNMYFIPKWVVRTLIWYWDYGHDTAKPTYFFSNRAECLEWFDAPHVWKPGSQTIKAEDKRGYLARGKMPVKLVERIAQLAIKYAKGE